MMDRSADATRLRHILASHPDDRVSWHNLAAAEGDLGRVREAEAAARRAIELGITAPETRLVLARALQSQRRLDEAQRMFQEAIALRPAYVEAHRDLAQLLWMRTGKAKAALANVDGASRAAPRVAGLHLVRSLILETGGDAEAALAAALNGLERCPDETELLRQASHLCLATGENERALVLARQAQSLAPQDAPARTSVCVALLALGRIDEAEGLVESLREELPRDQYVLALQATLWRLQGDPRYAELYDYPALVGSRLLEPPHGWESIGAFMAALAPELHAMHEFSAHPFTQSVRGGSQLPLQAPELAHPLVAALFGSIAAAIDDYLHGIGTGEDPFRSRNTGRFGITGAWSVRLTSGGYHTDHVHPAGWLSSACYVATPSPHTGSIPDADHAGWLRLGVPGIATVPPLTADAFVQPKPGLLVLFPAYVWHGVVPFESDSPRLSIAFDAAPL